MTLSILICTLPERYTFLQRLDEILAPQLARFPQIEIKKSDVGRSMTTGEKRNWLITNSTGEYFVAIDDDDIVPEYYCEEIIKAMETKPDTITFKGFMTTDGRARKNFLIKLGSDYRETHDCYYRFPNHICPMRREVVQQIPFPHITVQEDFQWADRIRQRGLLKTSVHIDKDMYHYDFRTRK